MRVSIRVGSVRLDVDGLDLSKRQILNLLGQVAGIADALAPVLEEEPERPPLGFTAHLERLVEEPFGEPYENEPDEDSVRQ